MKVDKQYGPQFDATDGTIGELQLVKRLVIMHGPGDGEMVYARQGRYTHPMDGQSAAQVIEALSGATQIMENLRAVAFWCYPGHHDPVGPIPTDLYVKVCVEAEDIPAGLSGISCAECGDDWLEPGDGAFRRVATGDIVCLHCGDPDVEQEEDRMRVQGMRRGETWSFTKAGAQLIILRLLKAFRFMWGEDETARLLDAFAQGREAV